MKQWCKRNENGIGCGCLIVLVVVIVFSREWYIKTAAVFTYEKGGENNSFPVVATDIGRYYSFSRTCYEYTIKIDDFLYEAKLQGWNWKPIPDAQGKGKEICCFRYEKYKNGDKITKDYFYQKKITHGYYYDTSIEGHCSLYVYCSDTQRLYYTSSR